MTPRVELLPGQPFFRPGAYDVADFGYALREFTFAGVAQSYHADGTPAGEAPYKSRLVTLLPDDSARFSGTIIVEWLNVSGGVDAPVIWVNAHREILRRGHGYVAVSAQKVGVEGGPSLNSVAPSPLRGVDPQRYGSLVHPGDAFSYDIFSDAARLLRGAQREAVLGPLLPRCLLAAGESQSAIYLASYVNAVDRAARVYDGFLVHSRPATAAPLDNSFMFEAPLEWQRRAVRLEPDLRVPVLQFVTETDLLRLGNMTGFHAARQLDTGHLRSWELAGSAHADNYLFAVGQIDVPGLPIERLAQVWAPLDNVMGRPVARPPNNGPQHHYVLQAALRRLEAWARDGEAAPHGEVLQLAAGDEGLLADAHGNALGGVRTPWVDVPISRLSGDPGPSGSDIVGMVAPFGADEIQRLYPAGKTEYLQRFGESLDSAIARGFILVEDREEILLLAAAGFPPDA